MNCAPASLIQAARCFSCLPKVEFNGAVIYALCQWANAGQERISDLMLQWVQQVIDNGGAEPTQDTKNAVNTFALGLEDSGLYAKMKAVNCMVPDSLIACRTPLIANYGDVLWASNNFVAGDLTANGLKGGTLGQLKRLDTGLNPTTAFASNNSAGLTLYTDTEGTPPASDTQGDMGIWETGQMFQLLTSYGSVVGIWEWYFDCWDVNAGNGRTTAAIPGDVYWNGYTSGNRTAANNAKIYRANSSTAHAEVASSPGAAIGTRPNYTLPVFCINDQVVAMGYAGYSPKRISFVAIHEGLTEAESNTLFNLVQALRVALGGGWV